MAPLINTIGFLIHNLKNINKKSLLSRINQLKVKRKKIFTNLKSNFKSFINNIRKETISIMLISYSSTIIHLLNDYKNENLQIYILESRPLFEGRRVAKILSQKFETHLIIDAAMGKFMDNIDVILIGVDSILGNGSIINKVGTYPLTVLAKTLNKQVCAICDSFKYNLWSHYGIEIKIEEKAIKEVYHKKIERDSLHVHNYYFDITPKEFIDLIISDLGILSVDNFLSEIQKNLPIDWFKKFIVP